MTGNCPSCLSAVLTAGVLSDISNDLDGPITQPGYGSVKVIGNIQQFSRSQHFWSRISQIPCILRTEFLQNTNRKPHPGYSMVPLSVTLSDLWPRFSRSWHFFEVAYLTTFSSYDKMLVIKCLLSWLSVANDKYLLPQQDCRCTDLCKLHSEVTVSSADADKPVQRVQRSVRYVRYASLLVVCSNFTVFEIFHL